MSPQAEMTAWCRSAGPEWSVVATEDDEFRLLFRSGRVLYCYPMGDAVTAWVDMSEPEDVPHLLTVGQSKFGFNEGDPRGIRLRVTNLAGLLEWCRVTAPTRRLYAVGEQRATSAA